MKNRPLNTIFFATSILVAALASACTFNFNQGSGGGSSSTSSTSGVGAGGAGGSDASCAGDADCIPLVQGTKNLCVTATCESGVCVTHDTDDGKFCQSGVGLCAKGAEKSVCVVPLTAEACKIPAPSTDNDACDPALGIEGPGVCDDGSECTQDFCDKRNNTCQHYPALNGAQCSLFGSCQWGACCIFKPACDQSNGNSPCAGKVDGTVCVGSFGGGLCENGACCTPSADITPH